MNLQVIRTFSIVVTLSITCFAHSSHAETAVSEKAQRFFDRGTAAIKAADKPEDFRDAAAEFNKASAAAPSWPDPYYNAGVALDKAGDPAGAYKAFKSYLKAAPNAPDAKQVHKKANELEYLAEKQAKAKAQNKSQEFSATKLLKSLEGAIYGYSSRGSVPITPAYRISKGKIVCGTYVFSGGPPGFTGFDDPHTPIDSNLNASKACSKSQAMCADETYATINFSLSPDGKTLVSRNNCKGAQDYTLLRLE